MSRGGELAQYLDEAASWDADRAAQANRSKRIAWIVAGAGWACTGMVATALMMLMPLKRVEPFLIRVNDTTGVVDVVPTYAGRGQLPELATRFLLRHYVATCERFYLSTAESDYYECGAFHAPKRNATWSQLWARGNPASPLNLYKDGSSIGVDINSVSFFERTNGVADTAQVRYIKTRRGPDGNAVQRTYWIATIQYAYDTLPEDGTPSRNGVDSEAQRQRNWNPFGFRVVDFRTEQEAVVETEPTASASRTAQAVP